MACPTQLPKPVTLTHKWRPHVAVLITADIANGPTLAPHAVAIETYLRQMSSLWNSSIWFSKVACRLMRWRMRLSSTSRRSKRATQTLSEIWRTSSTRRRGKLRRWLLTKSTWAQNATNLNRFSSNASRKYARRSWRDASRMRFITVRSSRSWTRAPKKRKNLRKACYDWLS